MAPTPPHPLLATVLALLTTPFLLGVTASAAVPPPAAPPLSAALPPPAALSPSSAPPGAAPHLSAGTPPLPEGEPAPGGARALPAGAPALSGHASSLPGGGPRLVRQPGTPLGWFAWPLAPPHPVLRPFEPPATPYGPGHRGVDLGGATGDQVVAAAGGVVVFAGQLAGRGVVSVDHPGGLRTTYEPIGPSVEPGQRVATGEVLGVLRPGHCRTVPACLHWGVRKGGEYLDPLTLVPPAGGRVRLLPWKEDHEPR